MYLNDIRQKLTMFVTLSSRRLNSCLIAVRNNHLTFIKLAYFKLKLTNNMSMVLLFFFFLAIHIKFDDLNILLLLEYYAKYGIFEMLVFFQVSITV